MDFKKANSEKRNDLYGNHKERDVDDCLPTTQRDEACFRWVNSSLNSKPHILTDLKEFQNPTYAVECPENSLNVLNLRANEASRWWISLEIIPILLPVMITSSTTNSWMWRMKRDV